ncbi:MAG: Hsp70 family protein [Planctomycetota bacterium]
MSEPIFGIDLGTTNSVIAVVRDGKPEVLAIDGSPIVPSVVGFDPTGQLLVGNRARNQRAAFPDRTISSVKRRMGSSDRIRLAHHELAPPEVSALILKELCRGAQLASGIPVRRVVITVPAFFQDAQRAATRAAGEIAGLEVVRLINEPTAAALAFDAGERGRERTLLVYDLGGGTFDVSIVTTDGELTEVLASHGDVRLGGDDFDELLVQRLLSGLPRAHELDAVGRARVLEAAERAKCKLTEEVSVRVREEFLTAGTDPIHLDARIDREEFESAIEPLLDRTLDSVQEALLRSGRSLAEVDDVLLVGGQTRTPRVAEKLTQLLGSPPRRDVHPDLCVALGAAIAGAQAQGVATGRVLVDVTPYTFGASALDSLDDELGDEVFVPLIERGTPLPVVRSRNFFTVRNNQSAVEARIFQGEHQDPRQNLLVGRFLADGLSPRPACSPVVFRFSLGLDGILEVSVSDPVTGHTSKARFEGATTRMSESDLTAARARTLALFAPSVADVDDRAASPTESDDRDTATPTWVAALRELIERARSLTDRMAAADRDDAEMLIQRALDAIADDDRELGLSSGDELEDLIHYVEEA